MNRPSEHKTVHPRILAYAQEIDRALRPPRVAAVAIPEVEGNMALIRIFPGKINV